MYKKALDTTQSFIVQAPAGSGKTSLLIDRYLNLLAQVNTPESVVVMTFTNQAANELKDRINKLLKNANNIDNNQLSLHEQQSASFAKTVLSNSKKHNWQLLDHPQRLQITTIDGLSLQLVSRETLATKLIPTKIIEDAYQLECCYQDTVRAVINLIYEHKYQQLISQVLQHLDNSGERFIELFVLMLKNRDQWLRHLNKDSAANNDLKKDIIGKHLDKLKNALKLMPSLKALIDQSPTLSSEVKANFASDKPEQEDFIALADKLLTKAGKVQTKLPLGFNKKNYTYQLEQLDILNLTAREEFIADLAEVDKLPDWDGGPIDGAILSVLKLCAAQLLINFAQIGAVDFIQIASEAVNLLTNESNPSEASLYLDNAIDHLLVDEFQDTSKTQFELIKAITKDWRADQGKTLFLVGDPMQSIYRFRQAQVGLFLQVQQNGIGNIKPILLQLEQNFRSQPKLVKDNNSYFVDIFPKHNDINSGAISYAKSSSDNPQLTKTATKFIGFHQDQQIQEAVAVCDIIQQQQIKYPQWEIAILVRVRSHLNHIISALNQRNIDFNAQQIYSLANNRHLKDLISLSCALLYLADKLSWLSLLRCPWFGLKLADLLLIANEKYLSVWQAINDLLTSEKLTHHARTRLGILVQVFTPFINQASRIDLVQSVRIILKQLEVGDYLDEIDKEAQIMFLDLLTRQQINAGSINRQTLTNQLNNLYQDSKNIAKVHLMTIYGAKGLEFDCVILPGLGRMPRKDTSPILHFIETDNGVLSAVIKSASASGQSKTYDYIKAQIKRQNDYELIRLLYVASTRAKAKNFFLGHKAESNKAPVSSSLLALLWKQFKPNFAPPLKTKEPIKNQQAPLLAYQEQQQLLNTKTIISEKQHSAVDLNLNLASQQKVGAFVHTILEHHHLKKTLIPDKIILKRQLQALGISPKLVTNASNLTTQLLTKLETADFYQWLFKPRTSTLVEKTFHQLDKYHNITQTIVVDRLFIDNNILWIIDYKTQYPTPNQSLDNFLAEQSQSHQSQLQNYATILKQYYQKPIKAAVCLLFIPKLIELAI